DASAAANIGRADVARSGHAWEVVAGPKDNNAIGASTFAAWKAWKALGGRPLELTLIRHFQGLAWLEQVSGHPGLTVRQALPGWTRVEDGVAGTRSHVRDGAPFTPPVPAVDVDDEVLATFFDGA